MIKLKQKYDLTMAIDILFELIEKGQYILAWSFMLDYENSKNPFTDRKTHIQSISTLCKEIIMPHNDIRLIAKNIVEKSNAKEKDALHLACAIYNRCEYFITCDDKFIKTIIRNKNKLEEVLGNIRLFNPIDFLRKEMEIDVIE